MPELSNLETLQVRLYTMEQFLVTNMSDEQRADYSALLDANVKARSEQHARRAEKAHANKRRADNAPPGAPQADDVGADVMRLISGKGE